MRDRLVLILASGALVLAGCAAPSSHHTRATGTTERRGSAMAAGSAIVFATDPDEGPPILYVVEADGSFVAAFQRGSGVVLQTRELPAAMLARFGAEMDALLASGETVAAAPHSRDSRLYYFSGQGRWEGQWDGVVRPGWGLTAYTEKHGPFLAFATAWVRIGILAANAATVEGTPMSREETLGRIQNAAARGALSECVSRCRGRQRAIDGCARAAGARFRPPGARARDGGGCARGAGAPSRAAGAGRCGAGAGVRGAGTGVRAAG